MLWVENAVELTNVRAVSYWGRYRRSHIRREQVQRHALSRMKGMCRRSHCGLHGLVPDDGTISTNIAGRPRKLRSSFQDFGSIALLITHESQQYRLMITHSVSVTLHNTEIREDLLFSVGCIITTFCVRNLSERLVDTGARLAAELGRANSLALLQGP